MSDPDTTLRDTAPPGTPPAGAVTPDPRPQPPEPADAADVPKGLPIGYRPGLITAITVLLGMSLSFLRYWGFEASGRWGFWTLIPAAVVAAGTVLQLVALFRSLRLSDETPREYERTVRWFLIGVIVTFVGSLLCMLFDMTD